MARQLAVVALVFFAIIGMASAVADAPAAGGAAADSSRADAPSAGGAAATEAAHGPSSDNTVVGNTEGSTDAAPVGGPVSPGTFTTVSPVQGPGGASAASSIELSPAFAGAIFATFAGAFVF